MSEERTLTVDDLDVLAAPLPFEAHFFRKGRGNLWYTYVTEYHIKRRLAEVDPGWEFMAEAPQPNSIIGGAPFVSVVAHMTVKGVTRTSVGTAQAKENRKDDSAEFYPLDENDYKAALTDALRRCARLFMVGDYLLQSPLAKARDERQAKEGFWRWYERQYPAEAEAYRNLKNS